MNPTEFIRKWEKSTLKESAAAQSHFNDLCELLNEPKPTDVDQTGETYCFEKGASKSSGGNGFADVWKKGCFGWEYKGPHKDLDRAYEQLLRYSVALENPPLLIVSDTKKIIIRTNWTNTVQEAHEIALTDLIDAAKRELLKGAFFDPERLKPRRTRTQLTAEAADEFSNLAQRLRSRRPDGENESDFARRVAHFVNRLVFCMFAEDVGLLPNKMFQKAMELAERTPEKAQIFLQQLFSAMKDGGAVGFEEVPWFNGGLFDSDEALPMDRDDVALALKAAKLDWQDIDPSILGTLFERGLDPSKRSQLGAHYTDREKIMMIVNPVIIEPLSREWDETKAEIEAELEKVASAKSPSAKTKAQKRAEALHIAYVEKLKNFRVLDPACGSGNFLYLSLLALKDLEHKANIDAETLGLPRAFPHVGPEAVKGIEINPYAAELARVSIWIGEIQWMRRNGFAEGRNPVLRPLGNIECRDAILAENGEPAEWPDADVIVGNPPFLGGKSMLRTLGEEPTKALRNAYKDQLAAFSDLVLYWFVKSNELIQANRIRRCGFVATKAIAKNANLPVLISLRKSAVIFNAWANEQWIVDGAKVRVSLVCFSSRTMAPDEFKLNGVKVQNINANLTTGVDTSSVAQLVENRSTCFIGVQQSGPLSVDLDYAKTWLTSPLNANQRPNSDVLSSFASTDDIVGRPTNQFLIDFPTGLTEFAASQYEAPFEFLRSAQYDPNRDGKPVSFVEYRTSTANQNPRWWEPHRVRSSLRESLAEVDKYVATAETTEHRVFRFLSATIVPDKSLYAFPRAGMVGFGILQSRFHELWCTYFGNRIGQGNQRRYNSSFVYETFPFPDGLTPNIRAIDYADDPRSLAISAAAARLNELRENWLNPPDLIKRVPEVVEGYPDRILPVDEKAADILKKRTLTNLYNARPAWLENAHRALDEAVAAAYGWEEDFNSGKLTDDEILKRLFELNQERAKAGR